MATLIILLMVPADNPLQSVPSIQIAQVIQTVCLFLIPSLVYAFLYQGSIKNYLNTRTQMDVLFLLGTILLIIFIQPAINCIGYYNQQMILPEFFDSMKEYEESAEKTLKLVFADRTIISLIINLLVIAVLAGLTEEFFFRGCLQQIILKIVKNRHLAIWITAITFSAIHLQFYGFVPRVLLG